MCNQLQQVNMNIKAIHDLVKKLTDVIQSHLDNAVFLRESNSGKTNESDDLKTWQKIENIYI